MKNTVALVSITILILGSVSLKVLDIISEPSLVIFIISSFIIGLCLYFSDRIEALDLLKGKMTLKVIKDTETSVKELAKAILTVLESSDHQIMFETYDADKYNAAIANLKKLTT